MIGFHPLYAIALLVILVVVLAPVIAIVVLAVVLTRRRPPVPSGPPMKQTDDGSWISADGQWEWDGQAWVRRSGGLGPRS